MWVTFSILAALCWAVSNILDKYALTKWVRNPFVSVVILGLVGFFTGIAIFLIRGFTLLPKPQILFVLIVGVIWAVQNIFYFKAIKIGEVSRIIPLFQLTSLLVLLFAGLFLGEVFTPLKYLGIFMLVIGAIMISSKNFIKVNFDKAFWFAIVSMFGFSVYLILMKYLLNTLDYWTAFAYMRIGATIGLIPVFYLYFPELISTVKKHGKKVLVVMTASEVVTLAAVLFVTIAASIGYITLVNTLSSVTPFFILILTLILSIFFPRLLKEEINKSIILQKTLAIVLMFVGALLIT